MRMTRTQRHILGEIGTLALLVIVLALADRLGQIEMNRRDWVIVLGLWVIISAVLLPRRTAASRPTSSARNVNHKVAGGR